MQLVTPEPHLLWISSSQCTTLFPLTHILCSCVRKWLCVCGGRRPLTWLAGFHAGFLVWVGEWAQTGMTGIAHTQSSSSVAACRQGTAVILKTCIWMIREHCGGRTGRKVGKEHEFLPLTCLCILTGIHWTELQVDLFPKSTEVSPSWQPLLQHIALAKLVLKWPVCFWAAVPPHRATLLKPLSPFVCFCSTAWGPPRVSISDGCWNASSV